MVICFGEAGEPRQRPQVESGFKRSADQNAHQMIGSIALNSHPRKRSKAVKPTALWTPEYIAKQVEDEMHDYNRTVQVDKKSSPNERFEAQRHLGNGGIVMTMTDFWLRFLPYRGTRIVSDSGTIGVDRIKYHHVDLLGLRGKKVSVKKDPSQHTCVVVSHESLDGTIRCEAITPQIKYAQNARASAYAAALAACPAEAKKQALEQRITRFKNRNAREAELRKELKSQEKAKAKPSKDAKVIPFVAGLDFGEVETITGEEASK